MTGNQRLPISFLEPRHSILRLHPCYMRLEVGSEPEVRFAGSHRWRRVLAIPLRYEESGIV